MTTPPDKIHEAVQLLQNHRFAEAEPMFNEILSARPNHPVAAHFLGMLHTQTGRMESGLKLMQRSVELLPTFAPYRVNLAEAFFGSGDAESAIEQSRLAISIDPKTTWAYHTLGRYLRARGRFAEAATALRQATEQMPDQAEPLELLARCLLESGQTEQAMAAADSLVQRFPQRASAHLAHGACLKAANWPAEAESAIRHGIELAPQWAQGHYELGMLLDTMNQPDRAAEAYKATVALNPKHAPAWANLGTIRFKQALLEEALQCYARAAEADPSLPAGYCNEMLVRWYYAKSSPAETFAFHRQWAQKNADPLTPAKPIFANSRDPNRRLRIGYVSAGFSTHVVGMYLDPILSHHDRSTFEIFCYSEVERPDPATANFQKIADHWRSTFGLSHAKFADLVRSDGIDILIDTNLATPGCRLLAFARKPAPVQVNYLAYPATSGILATDYRLTDPYLDPLGTNENLHTEKLIRLPRSYWCYPVPPKSPPLFAPPSASKGFITFGSLNNFAKINDTVLELWAAILRELPNSRLALVLHGGREFNAHIDPMLQRNGIPPERVDLHAYRPRYDFFALHNEIDITLDPFPYNGPTTGLDSMWMGVPIVALAGTASISRGGVSVLNNVGLAELIANSPQQYIQIAVNLAKDLGRLANIRSTLRDRILKSPISNAKAFTKDLEAAYRKMWTDWCTGS